MMEHPEFTVYDPDGGVYYVPFISEDGRVGYRVGRTDDRPDAETFLYFNPSTANDDTPNVFVYIGGDNDPNTDSPEHFYTLDRERFGLSEPKQGPINFDCPVCGLEGGH